jgi:iron complex outermembrane recepter protein
MGNLGKGRRYGAVVVLGLLIASAAPAQTYEEFLAQEAQGETQGEAQGEAAAEPAPAAAEQDAPAGFAYDTQETEAEPQEVEASVAVEPLREEVAPQKVAERAPVAMDAILVTGSRIQRSDLQGAQPITVVERADIDRAGLTNIGDLLQRIPAAGSALNRQFNNGGNGQTEIDLRNLGSQRLLVLVNGQRWIPGTSLGSSAVDLNTIPVSIIERIEVLKDGASAIYGSDAITGVVNIITRKDFVGAELRSQAGAFDDGEGLVHAHNLSIGNVSGDTSMFFDISYMLQDEVRASTRKQSAVPLFGSSVVLSGSNFQNELVHTRGSPIPPEGYFVFIPNANNGSLLGTELCPSLTADVANGVIGGAFNDPAGTIGDPLTPGQLPPVPVPPPQFEDPQLGGVQLCTFSPLRGQAVDAASGTTATEAGNFRYNNSLFGPDPYLHNFAPINLLLTPLEQISLFGQMGHNLNNQVRFHATVLATRSTTERALAEEPLRVGDLFPPPQGTAFIHADAAFNPFDQDIGRTDDSGLIGFGTVLRRMVEAGPRLLQRENRALFLRSGFDGDFDFLDRSFNYDVGYAYGQNSQVGSITGSFDMTKVARALGPASGCPSLDAPGCVPLNLFAPVGGITPEMLEYISYTATSSAAYELQNVGGNISTQIVEAQSLLAGPIGIALGVEHRTERFSDTPDPFQVQGTSSDPNRQPSQGRYNVAEAYLELAVPLLADLPFARLVDLSLAGRYTKYNTFDAKVTGKAGLRWKPFDQLLIRGTFSEAFRAPNLLELFLGATQSFPSISDPCVDPPPGSDIEANCNAEGAAGATQTGSQILTLFQGNPNLDPETAQNFTAGFVWSPEFLPDFNLTVDYWDIDLTEALAFVGPAFILESCYERPADAPRPETCDLVERGPNGAISFISSSPINFARVHTSGIDVAFDFVIPLGDWIPAMREAGEFRFLFDSQYLIRYDQFTPNADGSSTQDRFAGRDTGDNPLPRNKANAALEWSMANLTASWSTRFIQGTTEPCDDGRLPSFRDLGLCSNPDPDVSDGIDDSTNTYKDIFYHSVQLSYVLPFNDAQVTLGVNNVLGQEPPLSVSAFANSHPATLYDTWGSRSPYLRLRANF